MIDYVRCLATLRRSFGFNEDFANELMIGFIKIKQPKKIQKNV